MNQAQWQQLLDLVGGKLLPSMPTGFIIDSPWLPGWAGIDTLRYFGSEQAWMAANLKAIEKYPTITFLPGFWSEFGMLTEPSAFGSRLNWPQKTFPHPHKLVEHTLMDDMGKFMEEMGKIKKPDPRTDGLLPLMLERLRAMRPAIEERGHAIRFATARGPLNIAAFLVGVTDFQLALKMMPDNVHALLETITNFLVDWIQAQAEAIPTIEGIFLLDDLVGFLGPEDFEQFALPYLKRSYAAIDAKVKFFHNDAHGTVCAPYLPEIGINVFNFSHQHSLAEMKELTRNQVVLLGNIPPRDVLAQGKPYEVSEAVKNSMMGLSNKKHIILSCGGGMAPDTPDANIEAFVEAAAKIPMAD
jgi:uroporphyrinogen decarboxylase